MRSRRRRNPSRRTTSSSGPGPGSRSTLIDREPAPSSSSSSETAADIRRLRRIISDELTAMRVSHLDNPDLASSWPRWVKARRKVSCRASSASSGLRVIRRAIDRSRRECVLQISSADAGHLLRPLPDRAGVHVAHYRCISSWEGSPFAAPPNRSQSSAALFGRVVDRTELVAGFQLTRYPDRIRRRQPDSGEFCIQTHRLEAGPFACRRGKAEQVLVIEHFLQAIEVR